MSATREGAVTVTLWRPESGVTTTRPLQHAGSERDVYPTQEACIAGMVADLRTLAPTQAAQGTRPCLTSFDTKDGWGVDLPFLPKAPKEVPKRARCFTEYRVVEHHIEATKKGAKVRAFWEVRFYWEWSEQVSGVVDGVEVSGRKKCRVDDDRWGTYIPAFARKKGDKGKWCTRTLKPESFDVQVRCPVEVAAIVARSAA